MYKLASLMTSELGRAYDTLKTKPLASVRAGAWPRHPGKVLHLQMREVNPVGGGHMWQSVLAALLGPGRDPHVPR